MHVEVPHFCKAELRRIIRPTQIVKVLNGSTWTWETIQDNWDYQDCTVQDEFKFIQKTTKPQATQQSKHVKLKFAYAFRNFDFYKTEEKRQAEF